MNRLLVTGLALGQEFGTCQACNFDLSWIIRYPSTLLWADQILLTPEMWKVISSGHFSASPPLAKSVQLLFDFCEGEKIFEQYNPVPLVTPEVSQGIYDQIEHDRHDLLQLFPEHTKVDEDSTVPGQIFLDGTEYCTPHLWTVYASLFLAQALDAQCLFSETVLNFCRYKFGLASPTHTAEPAVLQSFSNVFDAYLPNQAIFPNYAIEDSQKCSACAHDRDCSSTYLSVFEGNLKQLVAWREYDEIQQLKEVISLIIAQKKDQGLAIVPSEISRQFSQQQKVLRRRLHHVFPKIERWANVSTILSLPIAIAGVATGAAEVAAAGATVAGASTAAKEMLKYLRSQYSWVGFTSKDAIVPYSEIS